MSFKWKKKINLIMNVWKFHWIQFRVYRWDVSLLVDEWSPPCFAIGNQNCHSNQNNRIMWYFVKVSSNSIQRLQRSRIRNGTDGRKNVQHGHYISLTLWGYNDAATMKTRVEVLPYFYIDGIKVPIEILNSYHTKL